MIYFYKTMRIFWRRRVAQKIGTRDVFLRSLSHVSIDFSGLSPDRPMQKNGSKDGNVAKCVCDLQSEESPRSSHNPPSSTQPLYFRPSSYLICSNAFLEEISQRSCVIPPEGNLIRICINECSYNRCRRICESR